MPGRSSMNAALWVTTARMLTIPAVMVLILVAFPGHRWWAMGVYVAAACTDSLDGWLARARGQVTVAGAFLDPLADKLLVTGALLALIETGEVAAWVAMVIITRELAVTGLRLVAVSEGLIIPASRFGKAKTFSQNVALGVIISPLDIGWLDDTLLAVALVLTVLSGAYYFIMARRRLFSRKGPNDDVAGDP